MSEDKLKVKLRKSGNSLVITIPADVRKLIGWREGDEIEIANVDKNAGIIVLKKV